MRNLSDQELMRLAQEGRAEAFGVLFERHARAVYNFAFRRTADWSLAEDLTSVVFLEAWRRRDTDIEGASSLPWLLGVAVNVLRNHRRSLRRYRSALERVRPPEPHPDHGDDVAGRLDDERTMRGVIDALSGLPLLDREILSLVVWSRLSNEEAAASLGVPVGTVRSRLSRARSRLRELAERTGHERDDALASAAGARHREEEA